ncbi:hypothetical protein SNE40_010358 [Patella caerulea]|uniref:Nucleoside phosphorylase domain-containing protein n=1 Tax=Patella caerulea TaxID=87958 RepID=A0AAN8PUG9_PATCE
MSLKSNPHIQHGGYDFLYHLGINTKDVDIKKLFNDVKFVCLGGSQSRMFEFVRYIGAQLNVKIGENEEPFNYAYKTDRYCLYKAGPVLCANHGIGIPSLSVVINEIFKLLFYAECKDVIFLRIGTSGGVGIDPGTVVITTNVLNGELKPIHCTTVLGRRIEHPTYVDSDLAKELVNLCPDENYATVLGTTVSVDSFYEGQGRIDGALCDYTDDDRKTFLKSLQEKGVKNIEMESIGLFSFCHRAGYKAAMISVVLVNRLVSDKPTDDDEARKDWEQRPFSIASHFIKSRLDKVEGLA